MRLQEYFNLKGLNFKARPIDFIFDAARQCNDAVFSDVPGVAGVVPAVYQCGGR